MGWDEQAVPGRGADRSLYNVTVLLGVDYHANFANSYLGAILIAVACTLPSDHRARGAI